MKHFLSRIIRLFGPLIILFLLLIFIGLFYTGFPKEIYETYVIKKIFRENENIQCIDKLVSQKDFSACFDVYLTTNNNRKFVLTNVQIKNNEIVFVRLMRTNEYFEWLETLDTGNEELYKDLRPVINKINDY